MACPDGLITTSQVSSAAAGLSWFGPMLHATEDGIAAYRMRGHIAETPHGQIKHTMGFRQLSLRGKPRASAEWKFACTVHNLIKAITTGHLTATTLNHLASQPA